MAVDFVRRCCMSFPHVTESVQWGNHLVFKVGGRIFAIAALEPSEVFLSFKCSPEDFEDLTERPGIIPAPYLARAQWAALQEEDALTAPEVKRYLKLSYDAVFQKLPKRTRDAAARSKPRQAAKERVPPKEIATLDVADRAEWRAWLDRHHASTAGIWLVLHKRRTPERPLTLEEAIRESLCFGWIDSVSKRLDDRRYVRKFTPRKADSRWSTLNRRRYAELAASGLLAAAGRERAPLATSKSGDAYRFAGVPQYIEQGLRAHAAAWRNFESLPPSHRRQYVAWIDSAKREETRERRLSEAVGRLAVRRKLGMK